MIDVLLLLLSILMLFFKSQEGISSGPHNIFNWSASRSAVIPSTLKLIVPMGDRPLVFALWN